jgi:hypothetical protein
MFIKACVTNPTAAGRFLVVGGFTGLPLIFPHRSSRWFHRLAAHFSTSYGRSSKFAWKKCATYVAIWVQTGRRCGAARHGNCKSCSGSCAPVWSFPTPGRLPLFLTVTGRYLDARSSYYICSSTVTARHHFRPPDSTKKKSDIVNFLKSLEFG